MSWNYRLMAHSSEDEVYLEIHEVHYDQSNTPKMYSEIGKIGVGGETIDDLKWILKEMEGCLEKPILWAGEKFPKVYIK